MNEYLEGGFGPFLFVTILEFLRKKNMDEGGTKTHWWADRDRDFSEELDSAKTLNSKTSLDKSLTFLWEDVHFEIKPMDAIRRYVEGKGRS